MRAASASCLRKASSSASRSLTVSVCFALSALSASISAVSVLAPEVAMNVDAVVSPSKPARLTTRAVQAAQPGMHADDAGLYLLVSHTGT